jgi:hypothetical protein
VEARILWVDATANLAWTISPASVASFCEQAKTSGFNELIVDVKPINGKLLFKSSPTERFTSFRSIQVPGDYDLLATFSAECRKRKLRISAGINALSEGHSYFPGVGKAYESPGWQTLCAVPVYTVTLKDGTSMPLILEKAQKLKPGSLKLNEAGGIAIPGTSARAEAMAEDAARIASAGIAALQFKMALVPQTIAFPDMVAVFVDPLTDGVRERLSAILRSLASYDIDGIAIDRLRFPALTGGFGPAMRAAFEKQYGPVGSWPDSIFRATGDPARPMEKGPRFAEWMQFRAETVTELVRDMRAVLREMKPKWTVSTYVGAGWETYYEVGVNYGLDQASEPYEWSLPEYGLAGYARYFDFLMPGVFYRVARSVDPGVSPGRGRFTVEGGAKLMAKIAGSATLVYPALYGLDWEGNDDGLRSAIRAARANGKGVMLFDASYVVKNNWWGIFASEFKGAPATPPHALPSFPRKTR